MITRSTRHAKIGPGLERDDSALEEPDFSQGLIERHRAFAPARNACFLARNASSSVLDACFPSAKSGFPGRKTACRAANASLPTEKTGYRATETSLSPRTAGMSDSTASHATPFASRCLVKSSFPAREKLPPRRRLHGPTTGPRFTGKSPCHFQTRRSSSSQPNMPFGDCPRTVPPPFREPILCQKTICQNHFPQPRNLADEPKSTRRSRWARPSHRRYGADRHGS